MTIYVFNSIYIIDIQAQFIANNQKGKVENSNSREYGRARLTYIDNESILFNGISKDNEVWMSHGDTIVELPEDAKLIASTESVENAAYSLNEEKVFGLQFHPEVFHTDNGLKIFVYLLKLLIVLMMYY